MFRETDILYGLKNEKKIMPVLKMKYPEIQKVKNEMSPIDYIDFTEKICFELKSTEQDIFSYRIGYDKYKYYKKNYKKMGFRFMVLYFVKENLIYTEIENIKDFKVIKDRRTDRGVNEVLKKYIIIQRYQFKRFKYQLKNKKPIMDLNINHNTFDCCLIN